jgi:hypothetical protein
VVRSTAYDCHYYAKLKRVEEELGTKAIEKECLVVCSLFNDDFSVSTVYSVDDRVTSERQ